MRALAAAAVLAPASSASARPAKPAPKRAARIAKPAKPSSRIDAPSDASASPAYRYAQMASDACLAELDARKIAYDKETAKGVATPVRLTGPLHGVTFKTDLNDK